MDWVSSYSKIQSARPQTIGYGLVDRPVGLTSWIYEKMWAWTDNKGAPEDALTRDEKLSANKLAGVVIGIAGVGVLALPAFVAWLGFLIWPPRP